MAVLTDLGVLLLPLLMLLLAVLFGISASMEATWLRKMARIFFALLALAFAWLFIQRLEGGENNPQLFRAPGEQPSQAPKTPR